MIGVVTTKLTLMPFREFFCHLKLSGARYSDLVGQVGTVFTTRLSSDFGQIEIEDSEGSVFRLNARVAAGDTLKRGEKVLIVSHENKKNIYTVTPYDDILLESKGE